MLWSNFVKIDKINEIFKFIDVFNLLSRTKQAFCDIKRYFVRKLNNYLSLISSINIYTIRRDSFF